MTNQSSSLDIHEVMKHLPHRYPFLLIDRVLSHVPGESLVALKNVTINEPFFTGHFPQRPVMPGVLMLEAMAQATGILAFITTETLPDENSLYYFASIDKARFRKPVEPGDQLIMAVQLKRQMRNLWKFTATAKVDDQIVTEAELSAVKADIT